MNATSLIKFVNFLFVAILSAFYTKYFDINHAKELYKQIKNMPDYAFLKGKMHLPTNRQRYRLIRLLNRSTGS